MQKIVFEDTTVVKSPYVIIDGVEHEVYNGTYQGGTDLNANTFNQMQDNIESAIDTVASDIPTVVDSLDSDSTTDAPSVHAVKEGLNGTVLYNNATGTTENITLNDEIENYSTFKIFYTAPNVYVGIAEFFVISGATYAIDNNRIDQQAVYIYQNKIQISGTSLSNLTNRTYIVTGGTITNDNPISINKIIGYK
ncbi:MAG: hypothetical protein J6T23_02340 [Elusimicrobia bacterium]|nr:hypothetical protein [Elusimicrobiota bacterium]